MSKDRPLRVGLLAYGLDGPATGISRYTIEIALNIANDFPDIQIVLLTPFPDPIAGLEVFARIRLRGSRRLPLLMMLGPTSLALVARRHKLDLIHDPVGIAPFRSPLWPKRVGKIVTIHDMVPFVHPETHARLTNFLYHQYLPRSLDPSVQVITDSDSSKADISQYFMIDPSRINRIHLGVSKQFARQSQRSVQQARERYGIRSPYILAVGSLQPRKNIESVLDAYVLIRERGFDHRLVLVGPKAWKTHAMFERIAKHHLRDDILMTGYVDEEDLPSIYSGASCFVFPSLYEGFGFPPLEAMACEVPVVASNTSSLPEVTGDAAITVAPTDVLALADAVSSILGDTKHADRLRERGLAQVRRFSWKSTAAAHARVYRAVAEQKI